MMVQSILAGALMVTGLFFMVVGAIGFVRLPDVFSRLHVTGILDTLGAPLVLLAAAVYLGPTLVSLKLMMGLVFLTVSSPIVAHLLARSALAAGHEPEVIDKSAEFYAFARIPDRKEDRR